MEKRLFSRLSWISHTNARRAELFLRDEPNADRNLIRIIPNYPPRNWSHGMDTNATDGVIRIVYVGALGMKTMYVSELANWVEAQGGRFIWDIYTQQNDTELSEFLKSRSFRNVRSMGYVPYGKLASLLSRYDIGVILYRVKTDNFRYNAPNKLFEYLNCGLHVWFPRDMEGILPYVNEGGRPKVVSVNYEVSTSIDAAAESTKQHAGSMASFYCEDVYPPFKESLLG